MTATPIPPRAGQIEELEARLDAIARRGRMEARWVGITKHETKEEPKWESLPHR